MSAFIQLNDGNQIPQIGLGVWRASDEDARQSVSYALKAGYRHIDTAAIYDNETGVGEGIRESGIARSDIFLTTKLWNDRQSYDSALKAFDESLEKLGTDYVDLYLIHWPAPHRGTYVEAWKALIKLREEGRIRSIGVSNFCEEHLDRIIGETGIVPALNQIEIHPDFQQRELRDVNAKRNIVSQSWSPLGQGKLIDNPEVKKIAERLGRSAAQVILRWHIESGLVVIPKSITPSRIVENLQVFDFALDEEAYVIFDRLDNATNRTGPNPMTATF